MGQPGARRDPVNQGGNRGRIWVDLLGPYAVEGRHWRAGDAGDRPAVTHCPALGEGGQQMLPRLDQGRRSRIGLDAHDGTVPCPLGAAQDHRMSAVTTDIFAAVVVAALSAMGYHTVPITCPATISATAGRRP